MKVLSTHEPEVLDTVMFMVKFRLIEIGDEEYIKQYRRSGVQMFSDNGQSLAIKLLPYTMQIILLVGVAQRVLLHCIQED